MLSNNHYDVPFVQCICKVVTDQYHNYTDNYNPAIITTFWVRGAIFAPLIKE